MVYHYNYICPHTGLDFVYNIDRGTEGCGPPNEEYIDVVDVAIWNVRVCVQLSPIPPQLEESLLINAEEQDDA